MTQSTLPPVYAVYAVTDGRWLTVAPNDRDQPHARGLQHAELRAGGDQRANMPTGITRTTAVMQTLRRQAEPRRQGSR